MGIVNVETDSFSIPRRASVEEAIALGLQLADEGADIIDVGGESTRPGGGRVPEEDELTRVIPVVRALSDLGLTVSVDTVKAKVAAEAIRAGAVIVNDVSGGLADEAMLDLVAGERVAYVLQHWHIPFDHALPTGWPASSDPLSSDPPSPGPLPQPGSDEPCAVEAGLGCAASAGAGSSGDGESIVDQVIRELAERADRALAHGLARDRIILDPGLGFGKTAADSWQLVHHCDQISALGYPVLWGASRKRFLADAYPYATKPWQRDQAGLALSAILACQGVWGLRVHTISDHRVAVAAGELAAKGRVDHDGD